MAGLAAVTGCTPSHTSIHFSILPCMTPDAAHQYCLERCRASQSSFTLSFRLLKPVQRRAITAFYAYCRELDDIVDDTLDTGQARQNLAFWRNELAALYQGQPAHPITLALADSLQHYALPQELLTEIIDGMAMDLDYPRYPDYPALLLYCYRVASVVGLVAAEIFGYQNRQTLKYAHDLGLALQLTNICRDVGEDARRGRIYLPQNELEQYGVTEDSLLQSRYTEEFRTLMRFQVERAETLYVKALAQLPDEDRHAQRAGLIMAATYRRLLAAIRQQDYRVLDQRIRLGKFTKLWLVMQTFMQTTA